MAGVSKQKGCFPQIMNFNRVFHEINHPFWWFSPYFWFNTHIFFQPPCRICWTRRACQHTLCLFRKFFQWFLLRPAQKESSINAVPLEFAVGIPSWELTISKFIYPFLKGLLKMWLSFFPQVGYGYVTSLEGMTCCWYLPREFHFQPGSGGFSCMVVWCV